MAINRAEFEITASVKTDPAEIAGLEKVNALLKSIGLDESGRPIKVDPIPEDAHEHATKLREAMHELHETIHIVSRNSGELGHVLHYVLSPEAFGVAALVLAIKELKEHFEELNQVVKDFDALEDQLRVDNIQAIAKAFREAKIDAAEYWEELRKHGNQEKDESEQQQLHALEEKYGLAGGGSYAERLAQLRKGALAAEQGAKHGETDKSAQDQHIVDAAQKALDDYVKANDPANITYAHRAEIMAHGQSWEAYNAEYHAQKGQLEGAVNQATDAQRIDEGQLKAQQAHTEEIKKQGEADADAFAKLTASVAAEKAKTAELEKQKIIKDAIKAIEDEQKEIAGLNDPQSKGESEGFASGERFTSQAQFDQARTAIIKAGNAAGDAGNTEKLQELMGLSLALHQQFESKIGQHDQAIAKLAQQIQALIDRLKSRNGTSSTR